MKQRGRKILNWGRTYGIQTGVCFYPFTKISCIWSLFMHAISFAEYCLCDLHSHASIQTVYIIMKTQVALAFLVLVALSYFVDNSESAPASGRQKRTIACSCPPTTKQLAANCKLPHWMKALLLKGLLHPKPEIGHALCRYLKQLKLSTLFFVVK